MNENRCTNNVYAKNEETVSFPTMAYWVEVLGNACKAVMDGQNLHPIYSLLTNAAGTVKEAMA